MASNVPYWPRANRAQPTSAEVDVGLRNYMLRVYNYMGGGLAITGLVAYFGAASGFYAADAAARRSIGS